MWWDMERLQPLLRPADERIDVRSEESPGRLCSPSSRPGQETVNYFMQPISGLHIASLIDQTRFSVRLHHEDWHGPLDPQSCSGYDLVFLTGLQVDFDRMRQLSFFFRRGGATVVAGGSICTSFPDFATQFFESFAQVG